MCYEAFIITNTLLLPLFFVKMLKAHYFKLTKISIHIQIMASNFQKAITQDEFFEHFSIENYNTKRQ